MRGQRDLTISPGSFVSGLVSLLTQPAAYWKHEWTARGSFNLDLYVLEDGQAALPSDIQDMSTPRDSRFSNELVFQSLSTYSAKNVILMNRP